MLYLQPLSLLGDIVHMLERGMKTGTHSAWLKTTGPLDLGGEMG